MTAAARCLLFLVLVARPLLSAEPMRAVINDPDGFVNVRAGQNANSKVVSKVNTGEVFTFETVEGSAWCKVRLASGKNGWMHSSRIRLHFTKDDLPEKANPAEPLSEIDEFAKSRGFDYAEVTTKAAGGDERALVQFFNIARDVDGAAAESHGTVPTIVYHLLGDDRFAAFLGRQPVSFRVFVRNSILSDYLPFDAIEYLRRHFPKTSGVVFRREMTDWPSPDGRFAVRKRFTNEFDLQESRVERAEVVEQGTGKVLVDFTRDEIGKGANREGEIVWSPDSRRVAILSADLTPPQGNLFSKPTPKPQRKQTAIYQLTGDKFERVNVSVGDVPGRGDDAELEGAILGHQFTEPVRWENPDRLILQRHEYYERMKPTTAGGRTFETIHGLGRLYDITVSFDANGKATAEWKRRDEPPE